MGTSDSLSENRLFKKRNAGLGRREWSIAEDLLDTPPKEVKEVLLLIEKALDLARENKITIVIHGSSFSSLGQLKVRTLPEESVSDEDEDEDEVDDEEDEDEDEDDEKLRMMKRRR